MKKQILILTLILLVMMGAGCGKNPPTPLCGDSNIDTDELPLSEEALYAQLFDLNNKVEINVQMSAAELAKLQRDHEHYSSFGSKSPIYRMADVTISITAPDGSVCTYLIPQVGVRMKGNTSRTDFYNAFSGIYNQIHLKLDFQETFDDEEYYGDDALTWSEEAREQRKDRTFATLEKIDLRWNKCADSTYLKELYAFDMYRAMGVPAPHMNLCNLTWSGLNMGVYSINEPVDKLMLEKQLPEEALGGDLYKCGWAGSMNASFTLPQSIGIEDEDAGAFFAYDLKTNKKTSENRALINLITELNDGDVTMEELEALVDMDSFLNYCAVSWFAGNPDDLRNNCNNFYIYFRADNGKAMIIPYDFDRCFGVTMHWNPTGTGVTDDDPFSAERLSVDRWDQEADRTQYNPLILYTVAQGGYYTRPYEQRLKDIAAGKWVTADHFAAYYNRASALYSDCAVPGKTFKNNPHQDYSFDLERTSDFASTDNISFREYMAAKLDTLSRYLAMADHTPNPKVAPGVYIRADYTDWECHDGHAMTAENGSYRYVLNTQDTVRLKVYVRYSDRWYGTECLSEASVPCETDGHTNIILGPGTYLIRFDPLTERVTVTHGGK